MTTNCSLFPRGLNELIQLLFDDENALHSSEKWIFSTEGHLLPVLKSDEESKCSSPGFNMTRNAFEKTICPGVCHQFTRHENLLPLQPKVNQFLIVAFSIFRILVHSSNRSSNRSSPTLTCLTRVSAFSPLPRSFLIFVF